MNRKRGKKIRNDEEDEESVYVHVYIKKYINK